MSVRNYHYSLRDSSEERSSQSHFFAFTKQKFVNISLFSLLSLFLQHSQTLIRFTRVGTLIVATIYLHLIQNRYMFRSFTVPQCSHQHCAQPVASDVEVVGYL